MRYTVEGLAFKESYELVAACRKKRIPARIIASGVGISPGTEKETEFMLALCEKLGVRAHLNPAGHSYLISS